MIEKFSTPEDINGSPETAPSKRLLSIFKYKKVADSAVVMKDVDIDALRKRCPRFDVWVGQLEAALGRGHFLEGMLYILDEEKEGKEEE